MYKKLVVISHTEHFVNEEKKIVGWGPTVEEINFLSKYWQEVVHVACINYKIKAPGSSRLYANENIFFRGIPMFGGKTIWKKIKILFIIPRVLHEVEMALKGASHVQLRVPMGIGVFLIPYFNLRCRKFVFWVKYANNWADKNPKFGFKFQRNFLKRGKLNCSVTINGKWDGQPTFCKSFENPCLYKNEIKFARELLHDKSFNPPYKLLFVGRIEMEKGLGLILDWLESNKSVDGFNERIGILQVIGNGKDELALKKRCENSDFLTRIVVFRGALGREDVHDYFSKSHFLLMPSYASEGFPKVFAESSAYGCIPVFSEISSIGQYLISGRNAITWTHWKENFNSHFEGINFKQIAFNANDFSNLFSFERYIEKLEQQVFDDN